LTVKSRRDHARGVGRPAREGGMGAIEMAADAFSTVFLWLSCGLGVLGYVIWQQDGPLLRRVADTGLVAAIMLASMLIGLMPE
jgi:hypothetical protein